MSRALALFPHLLKSSFFQNILSNLSTPYHVGILALFNHIFAIRQYGMQSALRILSYTWTDF